MPNLITSNDGTLKDINGNQTQWKIFSGGATSVTLTVKYTKNNSSNVVFKALRAPGTNGTKKVYITAKGSGDVASHWQTILNLDSQADGDTIVVGCNKTDEAIIFEPKVSGTQDATIDLSAIVNKKEFV